jgi:hypothetical protein
MGDSLSGWSVSSADCNECGGGFVRRFAREATPTTLTAWRGGFENGPDPYTDDTMSQDETGTPEAGEAELSKEQRVLRMMRKILAEVVKDTAPRPGTPRALSDNTVVLIRDCFEMISLREAELAEALGFTRNERPMYPGQEPSAKVIKMDKGIPKMPGGDKSH